MRSRMTRRPRRHGSTRHEHGAAAVEFALVTPLLLIMLFGIIDYGIWFSDSISARQAVRDGARSGAVERFGPCTTGTGDLGHLACSIKNDMDLLGGKSYLRVSMTTGPGSGT